MSDEIDPDWCLPPRPLKPLPQVARLTAERDALRALLVKACVEIADRVDFPSDEWMLRHMKDKYGIRFRWNETTKTFEEDTTK